MAVDDEELRVEHRRLVLADLHAGLEQLAHRYADRIIAPDTAVMLRWGALMEALTARGRVLPAFDSLLAATALTHDMRLVTRNTQHFAETGVQIIDPWALQS